MPFQEGRISQEFLRQFKAAVRKQLEQKGFELKPGEERTIEVDGHNVIFFPVCAQGAAREFDLLQDEKTFFSFILGDHEYFVIVQSK